MAPQNFVDFALGRLRERGFRITRGRRLVLDALHKSQRPLSPYALHDLLAGQGEQVDTVSIYRTLETLEVEAGDVYKVAKRRPKCSRQDFEDGVRGAIAYVKQRLLESVSG